MILIISILTFFLQAQDGAGKVLSDALSSPSPASVSQPQSEPEIPSFAPPVLRPLNPTRPPLLAEGTLIARAVGSITYDAALGCWRFSNEVRSDQSAQAFSRSFYLLPSRSLQDWTAFAQAPEASSRFEVYGTVTVYDGHNFLLPSLITPLGDLEPSDGRDEAQSPSPEMGVDETPSPSNTLDDQSSQISNQLEVRLQNRIGFLPMSIDSSDGGLLDSDSGLIPDGTRLQNRAGTIVRNQRSGAWRFLFDSQGAGERDPSIELLPCLHLQAIENMAMRNDLPTRIHASGVVTTFKQRNYLLLSLWRPGLTSRNLVR